MKSRTNSCLPNKILRPLLINEKTIVLRGEKPTWGRSRSLGKKRLERLMLHTDLSSIIISSMSMSMSKIIWSIESPSASYLLDSKVVSESLRVVHPSKNPRHGEVRGSGGVQRSSLKMHNLTTWLDLQNAFLLVVVLIASLWQYFNFQKILEGFTKTVTS